MLHVKLQLSLVSLVHLLHLIFHACHPIEGNRYAMLEQINLVCSAKISCEQTIDAYHKTSNIVEEELEQLAPMSCVSMKWNNLVRPLKDWIGPSSIWRGMTLCQTQIFHL
jgi:hypothetical protein